MTAQPLTPHRTADAAAIATAREILATARDAVLAVLDQGGWPMTSRIALQTDADGVPLALLSGLALHSAALSRDPRAAMLIDAPQGAAASPGKGMALTRARLSLQVSAELADGSETERLRHDWRSRDPKSAVYLQLPDFRFWRFHITGGLLNAGFGQASRLQRGDLTAQRGA